MSRRVPFLTAKTLDLPTKRVRERLGRNTGASEEPARAIFSDEPERFDFNIFSNVRVGSFKLVSFASHCMEKKLTKKTAHPPLTERLTFVIHRISARIALIGSHHFEQLGLNHYSARILVMVRELGEVRAGTLAELMVQPQSTISTQLRDLEKRKLIQRHRLPEDNRAVNVTLTEEGMKVANDCNELSVRVHAALVKNISADELRVVYASLEKLDHVLNELETQEIYKFKK